MSRPLIICRCEAVTAEQVEEAVALGAACVNELKQLTRAGMGPCQGRLCQHLLAARVGEAGTWPAPRWPVRPVQLGRVAGPPLRQRPADMMSLLELDE